MSPVSIGHRFKARGKVIPINGTGLSPYKIVAFTLVAAIVAAGAQSSLSQNRAVLPGVLEHAVLAESQAPDSSQRPLYETRANHDPNGTGKFYMGREIAQVMGPGGIEWLDRREREEEEHPAQVLEALDLRPGETVADLGRGFGLFHIPNGAKGW